MERARELNVDGRSQMTKDELKDAIVAAYDDDPEGDGPTKAELYDRAQELDVEGRSTLSKDELRDAVDRAES